MAQSFVLYCDLDGVLVDFDTAFLQLFKERNGLQKDTDITDLDEVIEKYGAELFYDTLNKAPKDFWTKLEFSKSGQMLWKAIRRYDPIILSSPADSEGSVKGKIEWVKRHLGGNVRIIVSKNKAQYVTDNREVKLYETELPRILIDDFKKNIEQWTKAGGIGILHRSTTESLIKLKQYSENPNSFTSKISSIWAALNR